MIEENFLMDILKLATPSASLVFVFYFFYKSGFLSAIAGRITKNNNKNYETRLKKIEENDLHDFYEFKKDVREEFNRINDRLDNLTERVSRIEGRLKIKS